MKKFNEWLKARENKNLQEWDPVYPTDKDLGIGPSFSKLLGEDEDSPFTVEVDVDGDGGHWTVRGKFWANEYTPNGSEPQISQPFYDPNNKYGYKGTEFRNPGEKLENIPEPLKTQAKKWIDEQVDWYIQNYEEEDPRDYMDRPDNY